MQIQTTKNYDRFTLLKHNRKIRNSHVGVLKRSITKRDLGIPIAINENYQVIDGQHRLKAWEALGLPVRFFVIPKAGLEDVQLLNTSQRNWTNMDFLYCYADRGLIEYVKIRDFMKQYKWQLTSILALGRTWTTGYVEPFRDGVFKIKNWEEAHEIANWVRQFEQLIPLNITKQVVFIRSIIKVFRHSKFDVQKFYKKLGHKAGDFLRRGTINEYLLQIDDIYNFRERGQLAL